MIDQELSRLKLSTLEKLLISHLPVMKIEKCRFLIGTEARLLEDKETSILVRVGGGYQELTDYLTKYGTVLCLKLH